MRRPSRRTFTGLRTRLVAAFVAVALLSSVLASGIAYVLVRRTMLDRAQQGAVAEVREIVARVVPAELPPESGGPLAADLAVQLSQPGDRRLAHVVGFVPDQGPIELPRALERGMTSKDVVVMRLGEPYPHSAGGVLHVQVDQEFARRAAQRTVLQRVLRDGRPYLLVGMRPHAVGSGSSQAPLVLVSVSLEREARELRSFARSVAVADAAALLVALVLALFATSGVLRPVRRLARAARALGDGDLTARVPARGHDELADLARTFNDTAVALENMVTASRRFVADVSHELRTPLTSMLAVADVLTEEATGEGGTAARLVAEETRRLGALVENLLEISRFDAGAAALRLDDVLVGEAVAGTLAARGWTGRVEVDGPADLLARLDPRRFDVIVANLAGNALRHGAPPVRLAFARAPREGRDHLRVTVTDHGPGIPGELLPVVFDRFVKAEAARSRSEGSGLGLSIARENAVLHGGELDAANDPAAGAVFTLWLPLDHPKEEP